MEITTEQIIGWKGGRQTKRAQNEQQAIGKMSEILQGVLKVRVTKTMGRVAGVQGQLHSSSRAVPEVSHMGRERRGKATKQGKFGN